MFTQQSEAKESDLETQLLLLKHKITSPIYVAPGLDKPYEKINLKMQGTRFIANFTENYAVNWSQSVRIQKSDSIKLKTLQQRYAIFNTITEADYLGMLKNAEETSKKIGIRFQNKKTEYAAFARAEIAINSYLLYAGEWYVRDKKYQGDVEFDKYALRLDVPEGDDCIHFETKNKNAPAFIQHLPTTPAGYSFHKSDKTEVALANFKLMLYHVENTDLFFIMLLALRKIAVDEILGFDYGPYYWSDPKKSLPLLFTRKGSIVSELEYSLIGNIRYIYKKKKYYLSDLLPKITTLINGNYCIPFPSPEGEGNLFISPTLLRMELLKNPNCINFYVDHPRLITYKDYSVFENSLIKQLNTETETDQWKFINDKSTIISLNFQNKEMAVSYQKKLQKAGLTNSLCLSRGDKTYLVVHLVDVYDVLILRIQPVKKIDLHSLMGLATDSVANPNKRLR